MINWYVYYFILPYVETQWCLSKREGKEQSPRYGKIVTNTGIGSIGVLYLHGSSEITSGLERTAARAMTADPPGTKETRKSGHTPK